MNVLLAVLVVGAGSLLFRLVPLLGAHRVPPALTSAAGWSGVSVLAAMTVSSVLRHQDPTVPFPQLLAAVAVGAGLLVALRGGSVLSALGVGGLTYLVLAAAIAAIS